jgi:hypothetical protein
MLGGTCEPLSKSLGAEIEWFAPIDNTTMTIPAEQLFHGCTVFSVSPESNFIKRFVRRRITGLDDLAPLASARKISRWSKGAL